MSDNNAAAMQQQMIDEANKRWMPLLLDLQQIEDPAWKTVKNENGAIIRLQKSLRFYDIRLTENRYRRTADMVLYVAQKKEPYWQPDMIQPVSNIYIKKYRRGVAGDTENKAKDIRLALRKFKKDKPMIDAYHHNTAVQSDYFDLKQELQADGSDAIRISKSSSGFTVSLFDTSTSYVRMHHNTSGISIDMAYRIEQDMLDLLEHTAAAGKDAVNLVSDPDYRIITFEPNTGYNKYSRKYVGQYRLTVSVEKDSYKSYTEHLQFIRENYIGRQVVKAFMLEKMQKK
jgi:hypothetical protein